MNKDQITYEKCMRCNTFYNMDPKHEEKYGIFNEWEDDLEDDDIPVGLVSINLKIMVCRSCICNILIEYYEGIKSNIDYLIEQNEIKLD